MRREPCPVCNKTHWYGEALLHCYHKIANHYGYLMLGRYPEDAPLTLNELVIESIYLAMHDYAVARGMIV